MHGLFGSSRNWTRVASELSAKDPHLRVVSADLRNHGDSPRGAMDWSTIINDTEKLLTGELSKFGIKNESVGQANILLGHSLGGLCAMQSVHKSPLISKLLSGLVIVDISPRPLKFRGARHEAIFMAMRVVEKQQPASRSEAFRIIKERIPKHFGVEDDAIHHLLTNYDNSLGNRKFRIPLEILEPDIRKLFETFSLDASVSNVGDRLKSLLIRGGDSDYVSNDDVHLFHEIFPHAQDITLENCGHSPHHQRPEAFVDLIHKFIQELAPTT